MKHVACLIFLVSCFASVGWADQATELDAERAAHFESKIRPVFATTCIKCHGPDKQEGELRLDTKASLLKGGESGEVIVAGKPDESLLLSALKYDGLEMPPKAPLSPEKIREFELWIEGGAVWPEETSQIRPAGGEISDEDRQWWAFQPVQDPAVPLASFSGRDTNEIDRFLHCRLADEQMTPTETAKRTVLVRRLYQTVIGLPPSPEEVDRFVNDDSPQAYEQLVDSLLTDQRYGEHWARFWLDLVRYAESDGWNADAYRPDIWRYRDYVVAAFNDDKPYADFVREQLAGDEIEDPSPEDLAAAGYLRLGVFEYNQRNSRQHWDDILNEITDVTADVFLGMGMACARCHDHKYDPILQLDYYKLRAFFEPIVFDDETVYASAEEREAFEKANAEWMTETASLREKIEAIEKPYADKKRKATIAKFPLDIQAAYEKPASERSSWDQQMVYFMNRQFYEEGANPLEKLKEPDEKSREVLRKELEAFASLKPKSLPKLMLAKNHFGPFATTSILGRDDAENVEPGLLRVLSEGPNSEYPDCDTNRRTVLANWIASPNNPLTTRVIVNRIWKQHFGRGLVRSVSDFGTLGGKPTHPELLDWLTTQFIADGQSIKQLQNRILMSSTWQQSATHEKSGEYSQKDPGNELLWRRDVRRLSAEQIRDAMLFASGELSNDHGGPSVKGEAPRRSLYVKSFRNTPDRFLHSFDVANGLKSVAQRSSTTTPTQALMMINGDFVLDRAKNMAKRLGTVTPEEQRTRMAIKWAWSRDPTQEELDRSTEFLRSQSTEESYDQFVDFCHVLLNSNEFLYVD